MSCLPGVYRPLKGWDLCKYRPKNGRSGHFGGVPKWTWGGADLEIKRLASMVSTWCAENYVWALLHVAHTIATPEAICRNGWGVTNPPRYTVIIRGWSIRGFQGRKYRVHGIEGLTGRLITRNINSGSKKRRVNPQNLYSSLNMGSGDRPVDDPDGRKKSASLTGDTWTGP